MGEMGQIVLPNGLTLLVFLLKLTHKCVRFKNYQQKGEKNEELFEMV